LKPEDWYNKKKKEYRDKFNRDWEYVCPFSESTKSRYCYETMMRMAIEKRYFGVTTQDEDVLIANAIMIREAMGRKNQS